MTNFPKITLKAARVNANLTPTMAAKRLGITEETLQKFEKGQKVPSWKMVFLMQKIYQYPIDYIFFANNSL